MKNFFTKMTVTRRMVIPFTVCIFIVMGISILYSYVYLSEAYIQAISKDAAYKAALAANEIDKLTLEVSSEVNLMAETVKMVDLTQNAAIHSLITHSLEVNNEIYGSTFALNPEAGYGKRSPYVYRIQPNVYDASDLIDSYDYEQEQWYTQPVNAGNHTWSDPYFDDGGGNALMVTYSVPVYSEKNHELLGVMTGDIALEWMNKYLEKDAEQSTAFIIDRTTGIFIVHPNKDYILNTNIIEASKTLENQKLAKIGKEMMNGKKGFEEYINTMDSKASFIAYCPTVVTNWSIAIVFDKASVFKAVNYLRYVQVLIMCIGFILFILLIFYIARSIKKQLGIEPDELTARLERLAKGIIEKTDNTSRYNNDSVAAYIDSLSNNLASIAVFADAIGKNDFEQEYTPLSDGDVLGNALLEMRANLQKAKKDAEIQHEDERRRNWTTEGLAKMGELLRLNNENLEALSSIVISEMVKYMGANQGGLFVLNDSEENNKYLELTACYAYDRKKFAQKHIELGEGLTGTCYLEGESIYITEIPEDYLEITSGLGGYTPKVLLITPLKVNEMIYGVIELASFEPFEQYQIAFVEKVSESIASTLSNVKTNMVTQKLLEQSKFQADELSNHEEELRQTMEEMQSTQEEMYRRESELNETLDNMKTVQENAKEKEYEMMEFRNAILETCNVVEFSPEGIVVDLNQNMLNHFEGLDKAFFIGKRLADIVGEETQKLAWINILQGKSYENVQPVDTGNGKMKVFRQRFMPICNEDGKLLQVLLLTFTVDN